MSKKLKENMKNRKRDNNNNKLSKRKLNNSKGLGNNKNKQEE